MFQALTEARVSAFRWEKSRRDLKFSKKFQGQGQREMEFGEKERSKSQACTKGSQGEPFRGVKAQRDKGRGKVGREGLEEAGVLASRGTTHLQRKATGH